MASRGSGSGKGKKKGSGSTRGQGRISLDGEITERISTLRVANTPRTERLRRNLASPVLRQTLKGYSRRVYLQAYELDYQDGCSFAQGRIFMESPRSGEEGFIQQDATFVVMDEDYETGRIMAQKMYDTTIKFFMDTTMSLHYLVAYCETLGKWVTGYEPFCQYWLESTFAPFYESDTTISAYWRDKVREMTESIAYLCIQEMINASGNGNMEWEGFDYLIKSNSMYNTRFSEWKQAILNHPILKDHSAEKLACYLSIHTNAQRMNRAKKTNYSNALFCKMPVYAGYTLEEYVQQICGCHLCS
uniref:Uncharacterized protein n=1 Tax=Oryza punctata TaxID=4537 RepID=A0A0E0M8D4_ORYPU